MIGIASFTACSKAVSEDFISYQNNPLNDTAWTNNGYNAAALNSIIFPEITRNTTVVDSFNCFTDSKLSFGDSIIVSFPANAFSTLNGAPITNGNSKVKAEITVLKKRGDFIKYGAPTTNIFSLLEAGNYCDVKLTRDGQEIMLSAGSQATIKIKDSTASTNMKLFSGNIVKYNKDTLLSWSPSTNGKINLWLDNSAPYSSKIFGYEFTTNSIRWFGAASYVDSSQAKTRLNVILPSNYTNKNTIVFTALKMQKTVISLLNDPTTKTFFSYNIPLNAEFTLVAISKINADYYLDYRVIKAANPNPVSLAPSKKTFSQVLSFLDNL